MDVKVKSKPWHNIEADGLVVLVTQDNWIKELVDHDQALDKLLINHLQAEEFEAKEGQLVELASHGKLPVRLVVVAGLGKSQDINLETFRRACARIVRLAKAKKLTSLALDCSLTLLSQPSVEEAAQALTEGLLLGNYSFVKYKSEEKDKAHKPEIISLLYPPAQVAHAANGITTGKVYSQATAMARNLVNEPASVTTPDYLAQVAKSLAIPRRVKVEVFEEEKLKQMGMAAFLSVAKGSSQLVKFIKLTYSGGGKKRVVLVGKAITFDTGGLSLKTSSAMETMKLDMAGAATVLGIFKALPELKPKVEAIGLIAACENMPGQDATKPGDIIRSFSGKTIEILNTDAEGRLTLADVLSYAAKDIKPDVIIDLATLTGACIVALGEEIAGLFTNQQRLADELLAASSQTGEKIWQMPVEKDYQELIKSHIADLKNITKSKYGGAVTAALFLQEFVDNIPWAHIDIAGPAFYEKDTPLIAKGGSGFGVRLILNYLTKP